MNVKQITLTLIAVFAALVFSGSAAAMSARQIMEEVERVSRESYSSSIQKTKLSTCKYTIKSKTMQCIETPRVKIVESVQKDVGPEGKDTRAISIILEPIGEKGIGMLSYDYDDPDRDADTWLYLSALGKVKRMISSGDDTDESGSFFGTEFSIEDMEADKINNYTYKILKEASYRGRPVWIIESVPTPEHARKTRYGKTISWIDRERYIVLKVNMYNRHDRPYKQLVMRDIENIDGVWIAKALTMNNLITRRVTNMELYSIAFNIDVPDEFLTQRTLTDFAFRERELQKLRTHIN